MKKLLLLLLCLSCLMFCRKAPAQTMLNGDFENIDPKTKLPVAWSNFMGDSNYSFKVDSNAVKHGKYSVAISSNNSSGGYGAIYCLIPHTFKGHELQLKGYFKTEDVNGGYAGLWVRIDGTNAFNNMAKESVHGTNDWKEYTIDLPYDENAATNINAGALLVGKGKMWIDDIRLYIDGTPVEKLAINTANEFAAQVDTAFLSGSRVSQITVNEQMVRNLTLLGQVWGFVKYHLPAVAKGKINMDAELFRVMPDVVKAQNNREASDAIEKWIDKLGKPDLCKSCKPIDSKQAYKKPDYGEIFDKQVISASLADKLSYILNNRNTGDNYYVGMNYGVGNPAFKHEISYSTMAYPDAGYRLLCLFRYWNMIQYFSPYKHLIGEDWNKTLPAFIPRFINAKDAMDYDITAMALISSIHDTHANIWSSLKGLNEYRGKYSPPFIAKFVEGKLVVTGYYNDTLSVKEKIKIGDVITAINGVAVDSLIKKFLPLTAASNYETQLRDMPRNYLLRSNNATFNLNILRDGQSMPVSQDAIAFTSLNFNAIYNPHPEQPGFYLIDNKIGYLFPGKYHNKDLSLIKKAFKDTKGIIIDMRCYPSEFMPFTFVPYIKQGDASFVKFTRGSVADPGLFVMSEPTATRANNDYKGKVVVIVNEESQSQAEYTTMAFQSSTNVAVIGSKTAGADGNVSAIVLPGGISTMISGIGILYPDGTETQRKGVKIDVQVKPTIAGIEA
ncbi:MAG: S41 family peptidase, partial [Mucilaginibacter sp.]